MTQRVPSPSPARLASFTWCKVADPRWVEERHTAGPLAAWEEQGYRFLYLVDAASVLTPEVPQQCYQPLREQPALFRNFAALDGTQEAVSQFAARFGMLGYCNWWSWPRAAATIGVERGAVTDEELVAGESKESASEKGAALPVSEPEGVHVESLEEWLDNQALVASALRLWDSLRADDFAGVVGAECLVDIAIVDTLAGAFLNLGDSWFGMDDDRANGEVRETWAGSEPVAWLTARKGQRAPDAPMKRAAVQAALGFMVTRALNALGVSPAIVNVGVPVAGPDDSGLRLTFQVDSLIGAMWLQLALAIDGNRVYKTCPVCGEWWDASASRSHRETCSDTCRKARNRRNRKSAGAEGPEAGPNLQPGRKTT